MQTFIPHSKKKVSELLKDIDDINVLLIKFREKYGNTAGMYKAPGKWTFSAIYDESEFIEDVAT